MFGFTTISIDAKGRLAIPAKYRDQLLAQNEESIVVTRDPQYPSLKIYPGSIWNTIASELQSLQGLDPIGRMLILLPSELREYAEIKTAEKVSFIGMGNKFEVWNDKNWEIRQTGGALSTEILEVVLPERLKTISF